MSCFGRRRHSVPSRGACMSAARRPAHLTGAVQHTALLSSKRAAPELWGCGELQAHPARRIDHMGGPARSPWRHAAPRQHLRPCLWLAPCTAHANALSCAKYLNCLPTPLPTRGLRSRFSHQPYHPPCLLACASVLSKTLVSCLGPLALAGSGDQLGGPQLSARTAPLSVLNRPARSGRCRKPGGGPRQIGRAALAGGAARGACYGPSLPMPNAAHPVAAGPPTRIVWQHQ